MARKREGEREGERERLVHWLFSTGGRVEVN